MKRKITMLLSIFVFFLHCSKVDNASVILLKRNGSWCWFQDERAIVHNGVLIFGSVADLNGFNGQMLDGNIEVTVFDIVNQQLTGTSVLHTHLEADDHNTPALLFLNDERVLAVYSKHATDNLIRYRMTEGSSEYLKWNSEQILTRDGRVTYSNLFYLKDANDHRGRIFNFYRGENWDPNFMISDDQCRTWHYGGPLVTFPGRPYIKYASDNRNKIHFMTTENHPRDFNNSIYHAFLRNDSLFQSDGTFIKILSEGPMQPSEGTRVFAGDSVNVAWPVDMALTGDGFPYIVYSVKKDRDPSRIVYRIARWHGNTWEDHFLAHAGTALYPAESDYSGLAALDPDDPDIVYISSDKDPVTGEELISKSDSKRHYEIFKGVTGNRGRTWSWKSLTRNSNFDNLRPVMPAGDGSGKMLLWLRGEYTTYVDYNLDIVGIIDP